jgi:hypothetical protein
MWPLIPQHQLASHIITHTPACTVLGPLPRLYQQPHAPAAHAPAAKPTTHLCFNFFGSYERIRAHPKTALPFAWGLLAGHHVPTRRLLGNAMRRSLFRKALAEVAQYMEVGRCC